METMAQNSQSRRQEWLTRVQSETSFQQHYLHGSLQCDVKPYQFRDEDSTKFFGKRNVLAYSQNTSKERASLAAQQHKQNFLENNKYTDKDPNRCNTDTWLRGRAKSNERAINLLYNSKNEIERVNNVMMNQCQKSFEPLNTQMLFHIKYRDDSKEKWMSKDPFVTMSGKKDKAWEPVPIKAGQSEIEPFDQKFVSNADFSRKRNTLKEVGENEFDSTSRQDNIWQQRINSSNSLRTYKSIQGYIKTINGRFDSDTISARDTINSMKSLRKVSSSKNLKYLKKIKQQQGTESSSNAGSKFEHSLTSQSVKITGPIPTMCSIQKGDIHKVEELINLKKEFTQQAALFYIPNQQLSSTQNQKFKVPSEITDAYLMDRIKNSKNKSYYKSAEVNLNKAQNTKTGNFNINNNSNLTSNNLVVQFGSIDNSALMSGATNNGQCYIPDIQTHIDIGQLLLNEKLREGSKENSPLISAKKSMDINQAEEQFGQDQFLQNLSNSNFNFEQNNQDPSPAFKNQVIQKIQKKTYSIQEESEETDEDSPNRRQNYYDPLHKLALGVKKNSYQSSQSLQPSKTQLNKINTENEKKKREFYALSPTMHKKQRTQQLQNMIGDYFTSDTHIQEKTNRNQSIKRKLVIIRK